APIETGISPPLSIMRPALISRSASLAIASIRAGVGPRMGWDEVTIYMKRIAELPLGRVAAVIARKTGSLWETTNGKTPDRQEFWKYFELDRPADLPGSYCPRIMISGSAASGTRRHCALSSASNCQVSPLADSSSIRP